MRGTLARVLGNRFTLWVAFVLVHLWLGYLNLFSSFNPYGDVTYVYRMWMDRGFIAHFWVGIDSAWVYPIAALVPMMISYVFGSALYGSTWLSMVFVLDAVALGTLTGWGRTPRNLTAGWWWVVFLLALGPIALGRIDTVSVAIAMIGILLLAKHPTAASVLITVATWVKVWPAAILAAVIIASRHRVAVIGSILGTSIGIVAIALAFGAGGNIATFVTQQTGRGLQIEAPISTIWLWRAALHIGGTQDYYNQPLNTFEVSGAGTELASAFMNPLLGLVVLGVAFLGMRAMQRLAPVVDLLPLLSLALTLCLIVFNKVGSPQYETWLAVPIVVALAADRSSRSRYVAPALIVIVIGLLTQMIYPFFYDQLIALNPVMLVVITIRNLLMLGLLIWSIAELWIIVQSSGTRSAIVNNRVSD